MTKYALIEIVIGPVDDDVKWGDDTALETYLGQLMSMAHNGAIVPEGMDPSVSAQLRDIDELGYGTAGRTVEEVYSSLGHYVSTYCIHGHHGDCRGTCKHCAAPCRCSCHSAG